MVQQFARGSAILAMILTASGSRAGDDEPEVFTVELKPVPEGSLSRLNRLESRSVPLAAKLPAGLKRGLDDDKAVYGVLPLLVAKNGALVAMSESADSKSAKIFLDVNVRRRSDERSADGIAARPGGVRR